MHISYKSVSHYSSHLEYEKALGQMAQMDSVLVMNDDQKRFRQTSNENFRHFEDNYLKLSRLGYYYEQNMGPKTKKQSKVWKHSGSSRLNKFRIQKSADKIFPSVFWDKDWINLIDYLEESETISGAYYTDLLIRLREKTVKKRSSKLANRCSLFTR